MKTLVHTVYAIAFIVNFIGTLCGETDIKITLSCFLGSLVIVVLVNIIGVIVTRWQYYNKEIKRDEVVEPLLNFLFEDRR